MKFKYAKELTAISQLRLKRIFGMFHRTTPSRKNNGGARSFEGGGEGEKIEGRIYIFITNENRLHANQQQRNLYCV